MTSSKYPAPDRSNLKHNQNARDLYFPEIDMGRGEVVLADGRPAVIEDWYDGGTETFQRTFFYSTIDTESWGQAEHIDYLEQSGLPDCLSTNGAGVSKVIDALGNEMWSISLTYLDRDQ